MARPVTRLLRGASAVRNRLAGARSAPAGGSVDREEEARAGAVLQRLEAGEVPPGIAAAVGVFARLADDALARSGPAAAAPHLTTASRIAFHRTLHFDGLTSPLLDDPDELLGPLRASAAWARATEPAPRARARREPHPAGREHRLLAVTLKNWKFLDPVARMYEDEPGVEVRRLDLADLPGLPLSPLQQLRLRLTRPADPRALPWAAPLVEALDWADTVFLDWLQRGAVLVSSLAARETRVVTRLHSFEAFTVFPHLVDYRGVDDLVVVGPHLGRMLDGLVPAAARPRRHVLANLADLRRFSLPKAEDARFTLAVVGHGVVAKDPLWAVEVLAGLRAHDPRYRLLLVGADMETASAGAAAYADRLERRLREPDVAGAVERIAFTADVPGLLRRVGVILSSSVRESFHLALVEGAASGAVPVVRDWPLFRAVGGPGDLFPADWITATPAEAVARVLATTAYAGTWRAEGARAAAQVLDRYDAGVTRERYDQLLVRPPLG